MRDLAQLRTRAARVKRRAAVPDAAMEPALQEAIAMCTQLLQDLAAAEMEVQRCLADVATERRQAEYLFDRMPTPCVLADDNARVTRANRPAAMLLNVSARHLVGQPLLHFTQHREAFMDLLRRMRRDRTQLECEMTVRPRERSALHLAVTVTPRSLENTSEWLWFLTPNPVVPPGDHGAPVTS